jgi:thiol-disulfide isomerase/thioredoxin
MKNSRRFSATKTGYLCFPFLIRNQMYRLLTGSIITAIAILTLNSCVSADKEYSRVAPGMWRGVLELEHFRIPVDKKDTVILLYDQFKPGELPFNFEVKYLDDEKFYLEIMNGTQRIRLDSIQYGRDRTKARDTMNVWFPEYASYLHAEIRGGVMSGEWVVTTKNNYRIPFYAHAGRGYRFTGLSEKPLKDISGQWATLFIAEFKQQGNHLEGTFRTETGDYGYLEGTVQGRKFWLSCFDGAHAFLFSGSIKEDSLQGEFRSGHLFRTLWTAWQDPGFLLGDADTLTHVKPGESIQFKVNTPSGQEITFPSPSMNNKIKVFTVMGTWCPNCRDEQIFLRDFLKENPEIASEMEVIAFSFERHEDPAKANQHLQQYRQKMNLPYEVVYAGKANKDAASQFFPALNHVMAFPTMMILDKKNQVRRVHTGFDGPATSKHEAFKSGFKSFIQSLR